MIFSFNIVFWLRFWPLRRVHTILLGLVLTVAISAPTAERYGDNLKVALPLLALGCQMVDGRGAEFALRYVVMFSAAHLTKRGLGAAEINQRPDGGSRGMPSAHTSTAALGASAIISDCLRNTPVVKGLVLISAAFVGASRIDSGRHDIWQVLWGALLGWGSDRAFRREGPARRRLKAGLAAMGTAVRRGFVQSAGLIGGITRRLLTGGEKSWLHHGSD